jgi:hypothetical protein
MAMQYQVSPPLALPPQLRSVDGIDVESYKTPGGPEATVVCVFGKVGPVHQKAYLCWYFSEASLDANVPQRVPMWEEIDIPTNRGILQAVIDARNTSQLRLFVRTNAPTARAVEKQELYIIELGAYVVND